MRFINEVVILFTLTICSWKCGQANAAPGFWDNDKNYPTSDMNKYFNDDKRNQVFSINSVFTRDRVDLDNKQNAEGFNEVPGASEGGVFHDVRNQKAEYNRINAQSGITINTEQSAAGVKPHSHKPTGLWDRIFGPGEIRDPFSGDTNQKIQYNEPLISDGPIKITSIQSS